jgi:hypothetical protein
MTREELIELIEENYVDCEIMLVDGLEEAFLGITTQHGRPPHAVYDREKCIEILERDMSREDAQEYFSFNIECAYVGESTPSFLDRIV